MSALSQFLHRKTSRVCSLSSTHSSGVSTCPYGGNLPSDTHGVLALADKSFSVIVSPWSDGDELKRVGSGTKLSAGWFHCLTCTVGQIDAPNGILRDVEQLSGLARL